MKTIDCRGQQCPQPVIQTRKAMLADPASPLRVLVDDQVCQDNVTRLAGTLGYGISVEQGASAIELNLTPGDKPVLATTETAASVGPTILFLGSDRIGQGDDELGSVLMKNFLFTLLEADRTPDAIYCVNSSVKLTATGSDVLEPLGELADRGVDVASCGLCLDFFGLKEQLVIGRVSNMLDLVNALQGAGNVIRV